MNGLSLNGGAYSGMQQQSQAVRITLCGSLRFEKQYKQWNERLSLEGATVYTVTVYPSEKEGNKDWYDVTTKCRLDVAHLMKILNSDVIFVIDVENPGDKSYVGESTTREILFAVANGKRVIVLSQYLEQLEKQTAAMKAYEEKASQTEPAGDAQSSDNYGNQVGPERLN